MKRRLLLILQDQLNVNEQPIDFVLDDQLKVNEEPIYLIVYDQSNVNEEARASDHPGSVKCE
jgi:hypothetical protein